MKKIEVTDKVARMVEGFRDYEGKGSNEYDIIMERLARAQAGLAECLDDVANCTAPKEQSNRLVEGLIMLGQFADLLNGLSMTRDKDYNTFELEEIKS